MRELEPETSIGSAVCFGFLCIAIGFVFFVVAVLIWLASMVFG